MWRWLRELSSMKLLGNNLYFNFAYATIQIITVICQYRQRGCGLWCWRRIFFGEYLKLPVPLRHICGINVLCCNNNEIQISSFSARFGQIEFFLCCISKNKKTYCQKNGLFLLSGVKALLLYPKFPHIFLPTT